MEKAKVFFFSTLKGLPVIVHSIQEDGSTYYIGHNEGNGAINGTVNMGFCCEVDDAIGLEVIYYRLNQIGVGDVAFNKLIAFMVGNRSKVIKIASIGEFVQVEDVVVDFGNLFQDEVTSDKACAAGDDYSFQVKTPLFNSSVVA